MPQVHHFEFTEAELAHTLYALRKLREQYLTSAAASAARLDIEAQDRKNAKYDLVDRLIGRLPKMSHWREMELLQDVRE